MESSHTHIETFFGWNCPSHVHALINKYTHSCEGQEEEEGEGFLRGVEGGGFIYKLFIFPFVTCKPREGSIDAASRRSHGNLTLYSKTEPFYFFLSISQEDRSPQLSRRRPCLTIYLLSPCLICLSLLFSVLFSFKNKGGLCLAGIVMPHNCGFGGTASGLTGC